MLQRASPYLCVNGFLCNEAGLFICGMLIAVDECARVINIAGHGTLLISMITNNRKFVDMAPVGCDT